MECRLSSIWAWPADDRIARSIPTMTSPWRIPARWAPEPGTTFRTTVDPGNIGFEDDSVVGTRQEHVRHREDGQEEGDSPRCEEHRELTVDA